MNGNRETFSKRVTFRTTPEQVHRLELLAALTGMNTNEIFRTAIDEFYDKIMAQITNPEDIGNEPK